MENNRPDRTAFVLGVVSVLLFWAGNFSVGWSQSTPNNWKWEAAKRVHIEKKMYFQQAACKTSEYELLHPKEIKSFSLEQEKNFDYAYRNIQHTLHLHGLQKQSFEKMAKAFLTHEKSYSDIFEELTSAQLAERMAVQLHCFKVGIMKNPEISEQLEEAIENLKKTEELSSIEDNIRKVTSERFAHLFVEWWRQKRDLLEDHKLSSLSSSDYLQKRYDDIKKYRKVVEELFRQNFTDEYSYSEFSLGIENIDSLVQQSGSLLKRWKGIKNDLRSRIPEIPSNIHQEMGMVFGIILDKDTQAPVSDIPLVLRSVSEKNRKVVSQIRSDERGRFVFPHLAPGKYKLSSKLKFGPGEERAYRSERESFFIRMDEVLMMDFFLKNEKVILKPSRPAKK